MDFNVTNIPVHTNVIYKPTQETIYPRKEETSCKIPPLEEDQEVFQSVCQDKATSFELTNPLRKDTEPACQTRQEEPEPKDYTVSVVTEVNVLITDNAFSTTQERPHEKDFMKTGLPFEPPQDNFSKVYVDDEIKSDNIAFPLPPRRVSEPKTIEECGRITLPRNANMEDVLATKLCSDEETKKLTIRGNETSHETVVLSGSVQEVVAEENEGQWVAK